MYSETEILMLLLDLLNTLPTNMERQRTNVSKVNVRLLSSLDHDNCPYCRVSVQSLLCIPFQPPSPGKFEPRPESQYHGTVFLCSVVDSRTLLGSYSLIQLRFPALRSKRSKLVEKRWIYCEECYYMLPGHIVKYRQKNGRRFGRKDE